MVLWMFSMCFCMAAGCGRKVQETKVIDLKTNSKVNPIGIDSDLRFSWKMSSDKNGVWQTAYRIVVSDEPEGLKKRKYVWDSGKLDSAESVAIPYEGETLEQEEDYFWKVIVWDQEQKQLESEIAKFEIGKMENVWENTQWISYPLERKKQEKAYGENRSLGEKDGKEYEEVSELSYDFKMEDVETGLIWGAENEIYGEYYCWKFHVEQGEICLTTSKKKGETEIASETYVLEGQSKESFLENNHSVRICVTGKETLTYLDGQLVAENKIADDVAAGEIGFWVERGEKMPGMTIL